MSRINVKNMGETRKKVSITNVVTENDGKRKTVSVTIEYDRERQKGGIGKAVTAMLMLLLVNVMGYAQLLSVEVDPYLAAAIEGQTSMVKNQLDSQNQKQLSILGIDTGIALTLDSIHSYERRVYDYLSKAQTVVKGAVDVTRCIDLSTRILTELGELVKMAKNHPQGVIVSAMVSKKYSDLVADASSLASTVTTVVTGEGSGNLLNSFERIRMLTDIRRRLSQMLDDLFWLRCEISWMRLSDIPRLLFPEDYYTLVGMEGILRESKREIDGIFGN